MSCQTRLVLAVIVQLLYFRCKMNIYVKSSTCLSALETFNSKMLPDVEFDQEKGFVTCQAPNYKEYISPKLLRRMSPVIRNGVTAGVSALKEAQIEDPDAIIVGTSLGCLKDTENFLKQLIEEGEQLPNPTSFIQSTHNTIAGQIALLLKCKNYNFTFTQLHRSFESALLDAALFLSDGEGKNILVGGVDEMNETIYHLVNDLPCFKDVLLGEGAGFFVLSSDESPVLFRGVRFFNTPLQNIDTELSTFDLTKEGVDLVIGGDTKINDLSYRDVHEQLSECSYIAYKQFSGEFGTATTFAFWMATVILHGADIPDNWFMDKKENKEYRNILIYNNMDGEQSLMVLSKN